jgi:uridine phosphorylase
VQKRDYPILEHDPTRKAIIEPAEYIPGHPNMPEHVVLCFFQDVLTRIFEREDVTHLQNLGSEIGKNPVHVMYHDETPVALVHPGVGAPLAAAFLEELIALGGKKFIACGGAGVLDNTFEVGDVIVPEHAVRDEGTSYHYLPPARTVAAHADAVAAICETLEARSVPYTRSTTWTTDACYRETPKRIAQRKSEGCLTVEMESAAFFAVAQFRDVVFGQMLYSGDDVSSDIWDIRDWHNRTDVREKLFWLAVESVCRL